MQPQVVLPYEGMVFALYSPAGYVFKKKLLFQVQYRVRKIADFGHNKGKGLGKRATHPHQLFWPYTTPPPFGTYTQEYGI